MLDLRTLTLGTHCRRVGSARQLLVAVASLPLGTCAAPAVHPPTDLPPAYAQYRPPAACGESGTASSSPLPQNYDDVRRWSILARPDLFPRNGRVVTAFLWYFIREDVATEETRLWRSSGSTAIDDVALEVGQRMRWRPALCTGQAVATWYGHPIALGGAP